MLGIEIVNKLILVLLGQFIFLNKRQRLYNDFKYDIRSDVFKRRNMISYFDNIIFIIFQC